MTDQINGTQAFRTAATWGAAPIDPAHDRLAYASPGTPPWVAPPAKKRGKGLLIGLLVGAVLILGCLAMGIAGLAGGAGEPGPGFTTMPAQDSVPTVPSAEEPAPQFAIGKPFRSDGFEYTIHGVKTGIRKVGGEYLSRSAQGRYTRLDVTIKNIGERAVYFDTDTRIRVEDVSGRRFSSDTEANIHGNDAANGFFTEINPGNKVRAFAYFDLPSDATAERAVISAGMLTFEADAVVPLS